MSDPSIKAKSENSDEFTCSVSRKKSMPIKLMQPPATIITSRKPPVPCPRGVISYKTTNDKPPVLPRKTRRPLPPLPPENKERVEEYLESKPQTKVVSRIEIRNAQNELVTVTDSYERIFDDGNYDQSFTSIQSSIAIVIDYMREKYNSEVYQDFVTSLFCEFYHNGKLICNPVIEILPENKRELFYRNHDGRMKIIRAQTSQYAKSFLEIFKEQYNARSVDDIPDSIAPAAPIGEECEEKETKLPIPTTHTVGTSTFYIRLDNEDCQLTL